MEHIQTVNSGIYNNSLKIIKIQAQIELMVIIHFIDGCVCFPKNMFERLMPGELGVTTVFTGLEK